MQDMRKMFVDYFWDEFYFELFIKILNLCNKQFDFNYISVQMSLCPNSNL